MEKKKRKGEESLHAIFSREQTKHHTRVGLCHLKRGRKRAENHPLSETLESKWLVRATTFLSWKKGFAEESWASRMPTQEAAQTETNPKLTPCRSMVPRCMAGPLLNDLRIISPNVPVFRSHFINLNFFLGPYSPRELSYDTTSEVSFGGKCLDPTLIVHSITKKYYICGYRSHDITRSS